MAQSLDLFCRPATLQASHLRVDRDRFVALGIGATAAVYSVLCGVLIDPYPYLDAKRLAFVTIRSHRPPRHASPEPEWSWGFCLALPSAIPCCGGPRAASRRSSFWPPPQAAPLCDRILPEQVSYPNRRRALSHGSTRAGGIAS